MVTVYGVTLKNDNFVYGVRWSEASARKMVDLLIAEYRQECTPEDFQIVPFTLPNFREYIEEKLQEKSITIAEPSRVWGESDTFPANPGHALLRAFLSSPVWDDPLAFAQVLLEMENPLEGTGIPLANEPAPESLVYFNSLTGERS
jgi:hypothetical protein